MKKHLRVWNRTWVPFCAARDLDPWVYDVIQGANCLAQEQRRAAQNARALGKPVQHAVFKHVRAGIGAIWLFAHGALVLPRHLSS